MVDTEVAPGRISRNLFERKAYYARKHRRAGENTMIRTRNVKGNIKGVVTLLALALSTSATAWAGSVNQSFFGTAVKGYDVVAYFTEGEPVKGSSAHTFQWQGATWRFASAEHRDLFAASPADYAPQYGGYCAYAVATGYKADIDPEAWRLVDGRLYLNLSKSVQALWDQDIPGYIAKADANWPKLMASR
jgi:hypothetical protein